MEIVVFSAAFVVAVLCASVMGYAIQRGATCAVAAVDEVVAERAFGRLLALVEAALWVAGGSAPDAITWSMPSGSSRESK